MGLRRAASLLAGGLSITLAPTLTAAQSPPSASAFAGAAFGIGRLAYAGATVPAPGSSIGNGWAVRATVSNNDYRYRSSADTIRGEETRVEATVLHQWSGPWGYVDVGLGARHIRTDLSPRDPGNGQAGDDWDAAVSFTGIGRSDQWRSMAYASYGANRRDYYLRGELTRTVSGPLRLGAEAVAEGDPNYRRQRAGLLLAVSPTNTWEAQFAVGGASSRDRDGGYAAISFRRSF